MTKEKTPYQRFKANYKPLYRFLLILSTLSTLFSLANISKIGTVLPMFETDPVYALGVMLAATIVPVAMLASLFLLAKKHPAGIKICLAGYGLAIISNILAMFISHETIESIAKTALEQLAGSGQSIPYETALGITQMSFSGALYISIFINILLAGLWVKAWRQQMSAS